MWWSGILNGNNNPLPVFHVASSGCCWEALCVYVWAVGSLHSSGRGPEMEHDRNSQLRVKCPERKKKEKLPKKIVSFSPQRVQRGKALPALVGVIVINSCTSCLSNDRRWLNVHRLLHSVLVPRLRRDCKAKVTSCIWLNYSLWSPQRFGFNLLLLFKPKWFNRHV